MSVVTLVLAAAAGFIAFWAGVVSLIGFMGWRPLAARYPAARWPEGEGVRLGWQSARVGLSNYSGALNAILTAEGLYLRPVRIFAYNHPPIFIPWQAVAGYSAGFLGGVTLTLEGGGGLRLGGRLAEEVRRVYDAWAGARSASLAPALPTDEEASREDASPDAARRRGRVR